jgi:CMP/dCMP kinase
MIITIDGPAKSGKSKSAEILAAALGYRHLNTGSMYRATGIALRDHGIELTDLAAIEPFMAAIHFDMSHGVIMNGIDYTERSKTKDAGDAASKVGELKIVRRPLQAEQQRIAKEWKTVICEGRDQGSVVFPQAPAKFYITASPATRALRQSRILPGTIDLLALEKELVERDHRDMTRGLDPLIVPCGAETIETDTMTAEEVAVKMKETIDRCRNL